jgi:hypothetical protein
VAKLWLVLVAAAAMALCGVFALRSYGHDEPSHKGRTLSSWVIRFRAPSDTDTQTVALSPQAEYAIREIGTNAIPHLFQWIRYRPPPWKTLLLSRINRLLVLVPGASPLCDNRQVKANRSVAAFQCMRAIPDASVVEFAGLINDPDPIIATRAIQAFARHASTPSALVILITNNAFSSWRTPNKSGTEMALHALTSCLKSSDPAVRREATNAFANLSLTGIPSGQ